MPVSKPMVEWLGLITNYWSCMWTEPFSNRTVPNISLSMWIAFTASWQTYCESDHYHPNEIIDCVLALYKWNVYTVIHVVTIILCSIQQLPAKSTSQSERCLHRRSIHFDHRRCHKLLAFTPLTDGVKHGLRPLRKKSRPKKNQDLDWGQAATLWIKVHVRLSKLASTFRLLWLPWLKSQYSPQTCSEEPAVAAPGDSPAKLSGIFTPFFLSVLSGLLLFKATLIPFDINPFRYRHWRKRRSLSPAFRRDNFNSHHSHPGSLLLTQSLSCVCKFLSVLA